MKEYERVEVQLHSFLNFALDGGEQLHSSAPYCHENSAWCQINRLDESQSWALHFGLGIIILPLPEDRQFLSWPAHSLVATEWLTMSTYIYKTGIIQGVYVSHMWIRPTLWSSGQSFQLQIQRYRVRFTALPDFLSSSGSGTGSTQPREVNWGATWIKSSGSGLENRD